MIRATRSDTLPEEELESKLELLDNELESKVELLDNELESKLELNPVPPEVKPDPVEPRLVKLVGGALMLEEIGRPRLDPKSKLDESKVDPKEFCWAESKLEDPKLVWPKLEKAWFSWAEEPPWMETVSLDPVDEATADCTAPAISG